MFQKLNENFPNFILSPPLFYSWPIGIRFEIGQMKSGTFDTEYFQAAHSRAMEIFQAVFTEKSLTVAYQEYSKGRKKIRRSNYVLQQIKSSLHNHIKFSKVSDPYFKEKKAHINRAALTCKTSDVDVSNILWETVRLDFSGTKIETTYFINEQQTIVLFLYDDRGMDLIGSSIEVLQPYYHMFNDYILDYDREKIDNTFS